MASRKYKDVMVLRRKIDALRMEGLTGYKIAKRLGVPESTVYLNIEEIKKEEILEISKADKEQIRKEAEKRYMAEIEFAKKQAKNALKREKKLVSVERDGEKSGYKEEKKETLLPDYAAAARFQANLLKAQDSIAGLYGVRQNNLAHKVELTLHQIIASIPAEESHDGQGIS